jgi:precorrin-2 methylase
MLFLPWSASFPSHEGSAMPNAIETIHEERIDQPTDQLKGSLVIVGSGIRALAHFTQEAIGHIREADSVFFAVTEGVTAAFIRDLNPRCYNLGLLYGEDKPRRTTYVQKAEAMLAAVRQGQRVVGVFYGHPGFFVTAAPRALAIARKEGYGARMLPGISAIDCLFADLGIDPSIEGCQIVDATDMLLRNRPLLASSHVVLLQVGSVGDAFYSVKGFKNNRRDILFERLIETYGPDHPSYHYVGATFPGLDSQIIKRPLSAYLDPKVRASISVVSTFYLPPRERLENDSAMCERMGYAVSPRGRTAYTPFRDDAYGPAEREAVARLSSETMGGYERQPARALYRIMAQLAANPSAESAYKRSPRAYVSLLEGLSTEEKAALTHKDMGGLHAVSLQIDRKNASPSPNPFANLLASLPSNGVMASTVLDGSQCDAGEHGAQQDPGEHGAQQEPGERIIQRDAAEHGAQQDPGEHGAQQEPGERIIQRDAAEHGAQQAV